MLVFGCIISTAGNVSFRSSNSYTGRGVTSYRDVTAEAFFFKFKLNFLYDAALIVGIRFFKFLFQEKRAEVFLFNSGTFLKDVKV